ncbi:hypothetical protein BN2475_170032 [Paraburkholderia ribeironis]|uniref:Uncharacterized protein n=1 Tax=Paraburkholderia ribeironis TaxID=1247936 RepID=A0A1N7RUE2_9BURK|nr:hypothetical protein BN2475_170032 [Paraburkholderia ribeironis]
MLGASSDALADMQKTSTLTRSSSHVPAILATTTCISRSRTRANCRTYAYRFALVFLDVTAVARPEVGALTLYEFFLIQTGQIVGSGVPGHVHHNRGPRHPAPRQAGSALLIRDCIAAWCAPESGRSAILGHLSVAA